MDSVGSAAGVALVLSAWLFPFGVLFYLLRAVNTIVLGMRSINAVSSAQPTRWSVWKRAEPAPFDGRAG